MGGRDDVVIALNEEARTRMRVRTELTIVPGATHLFEERGALERVASAARDWLVTYASRESDPTRAAASGERRSPDAPPAQ